MLTNSDFSNAASTLGIEPAAIKAFAQVESAGSGFDSEGHPKVLFERHVMYRRLKDKFGAMFAADKASKFPDLVNSAPGGYGKGSQQKLRIEAAAKIDRECALESASWGAFQIMGLHWEALGYPKLQDFINAMYRSEADHLEAFVRFVKRDSALVRALKAKDWDCAARIYNGPSYKKNRYAEKMAAEYAEAVKSFSPAANA